MFVSIKIMWSGSFSNLASEALPVWTATCHGLEFAAQIQTTPQQWNNSAQGTKSAAFHIIDQSILLHRHDLGIRYTALDWFRSYLSQWIESVLINGSLSSHRNLSFGVPQESVLTSLTLYTIPFGTIALEHGLDFHLYADGMRRYMTFKLKNMESLLQIFSNIQNTALIGSPGRQMICYNWTWTKQKFDDEQKPRESRYYK